LLCGLFFVALAKSSPLTKGFKSITVICKWGGDFVGATN